MNNRPKKKCLANVEYTESSGSVFADLGIPNPEKSMVKAQIAMKIHEIIKKKRLSQKDAVRCPPKIGHWNKKSDAGKIFL